MENAPPPVPVRTPGGNEKIWSILSHLSSILGVGLILPLIVYLAMKGDSDYAAANAREALNFHISLLIYGLFCIPLLLIFVGIPLLVVIGLASIVFAIVAAVRASRGECYRYPLTLRLVK